MANPVGKPDVTECNEILYTSAEDLHQQKKIHEYRAFGPDR
jgi:hypothetical protein